MLNPDPKKFYTLPEVFDLVGRELAGKRWTGEERYALDVPPTEIADEVLDMLLGYDGTPVRSQPWRSLWESKRQLSEALARGARRNKARGVESPTVVEDEPESSEEYRERLLDEVSQRRRGLPRGTVRLPAEWETWPELGSPEYIREFEARQRLDKVEAELRRVCHDNEGIAVLFDPDTGELEPLPCAWWWVDSFHYHLSGWAEGECWFGDKRQGHVLFNRSGVDHLLLGRAAAPASTEVVAAQAGADAEVRKVSRRGAETVETAVVSASERPERQNKPGRPTLQPETNTDVARRPKVQPARKRGGGLKRGHYFSRLKQHLTWRHRERQDLDTASLKQICDDARTRLNRDGVAGIPKSRSGLEDAVKAALKEIGVTR